MRQQTGNGKLSRVQIRRSAWKFEDLLNPTKAPSSEKTGPGDSGMGSHISRAEVAEVVKRLRGRALGMDKMCPKFLKALDDVGLSWLRQLYNV